VRNKEYGSLETHEMRNPSPFDVVKLYNVTTKINSHDLAGTKRTRAYVYKSLKLWSRDTHMDTDTTRHRHRDTTKLKNIEHGTRHTSLTNTLSTNIEMNLIYLSNIKKKWKVVII